MTGRRLCGEILMTRETDLVVRDSIRIVIVEDEPVATDRLRRLLKKEPDLEIVGEASSGAEALRKLKAEDPDLVFLDIHLPDMDAFDIIEAIGPGKMPHVVFVTAYEKHAIRAFEVHAVDYVLKPYDAERLRAAVQSVRQRIQLESSTQRNRRFESVLTLLHEEGLGFRSGRSSARRLIVKSQGKIRFVDAEEIDWIEAAGNYIRLHLADGPTALVRATMTKVEERLDPDRFVRIHRSAAVNLDRVDEIRHWSSGEYIVRLKDGTELKLTRSYRDRLLGKTLGRE